MPRRTNHFRALLQLLVGVAVLALVSETFLVLGVVTPVVINGSSMAPALLGPHAVAECPHCQWQIDVGADQLPGPRPLVCPDCRGDFRQRDPVTLRPGRRVWVDRTAYAWRGPRRWEVVVFRCPDQPTEYCVKRVLGLPGEQVDFVAGDLQVDGQVVRKPLAEQHLVRQQVHRERPAQRSWQSDSAAWQFAGTQWLHEANQHAHLSFVPPGDHPVTDDLGVNQRASRPLNVVTDLMVTCRVQLAGEARLRFVADFGEGHRVASPPVENSGPVVWSLFDRQALLAVDGEVVWRAPQRAPWPGPPRLELVASGAVEIERLTVWRDAYYHTRPIDRWPVGGRKVAQNHYFVVGDNVAISDDSRNWPSAGLPARLLVGTPLARHLSP